MMYEDELADFAERTLANLDHIRRLDNEEKVSGVKPKDRSAFPITQLVNSLLGLIVFPRENYVKHIPDKTLEELKQDGWPDLEISHPNPACTSNRDRCKDNHKRCEELQELVRVLRNGISHFNIRFGSEFETGEIVTIEISNRCTCCRKITTTVRFDTEQVRDVAERYACLMIEHAGRRGVQASA